MNIKLEIGGMTCGGCVKSVTRVLQTAPGVASATVDLESGSAQVSGDATIAPDDLVAAIEEAGFDARVVEAGA